MMHEWNQKCAEDRSHRGVSTRWRSPQQGWIKVNTDAAIFSEWNSTGVGSVIRNEHDCMELFKHYDEVLVDYVPRSANIVTHELARATYSMSGVHEWVDTPPDCIRDALIIDSI
ncbi:hypothetical protein AgCh_034828 [Apium graveolens]